MPKPSAWTPDTVQRIRALHEQGKSADEIASILGFSYQIVYNRLRSAGLQPCASPRFRTLDAIPLQTRERVAALARLGHSQQTIADQFGLKKYDVQRIAAQAGVEWKQGRRFGKAWA